MNVHRVLVLGAVLGGLGWLVGCGDSTTDPVPPPPPPPPPDPPRATTVTVSPSTAELTALDATVQLAAEVRDQNGQVMAGAAVTWTSGSPGVATVNASGLATAVSNGTATIHGHGGLRIGERGGDRGPDGRFGHGVASGGGNCAWRHAAPGGRGAGCERPPGAGRRVLVGVERRGRGGGERVRPGDGDRGRRGDDYRVIGGRVGEWPRSRWATRTGPCWSRSTKPPTVRDGSKTGAGCRIGRSANGTA